MRRKGLSLLGWALAIAVALGGGVWAKAPWHEVPEALSASRAAEAPKEGATEGEAEGSKEVALDGTAAEDTKGFIWSVGRAAVGLAVVCGLIYLFLHYVLHRLSGPRTGIEDRFRIVDKFGLEPKRTLYIMEICGRTVLLSSGEAGIRFLTYLDEKPGGSRPAAAGLSASVPEGGTFYQVLQRKLDRPTFERESPVTEPIAPGSSRGES